MPENSQTPPPEAFMPSVVIAYFRALAAEVGANFARNYAEFTELLVADMRTQSHFVVLDEMVGEMEDNFSGSIFDRKTVSFFILRNTLPDNFDDEETSMEACFAMLRTFAQRFYAEYNPSKCHALFQFLDPNSLRYEFVGPEHENSFGVFVSISFKVPAAKFYRL